MKKKKTVLSVDNLLIQLNSNYFFERALKSLDKQRFDKALKYFRKAVDYEPENPINYCNVAGVLSEMGNYDEANNILSKVIEDIDPKMAEVHFYMATNFAHMEQYEEAEDRLIQYLAEDEDGHFLEEAEEMIEFLQTELTDPKKIINVKAKAGFYEHTYARELLEQGQFAEAIALLEKIVEEQPDFLAAVNNLALAYYYVGFKEEAKHYIQHVLERDPSNLHGLCNLAIYNYYEADFEQLKKLIPILSKVEPFYQEHLYKLATTLGIMKEHRGALKHFERLIKLGEGLRDGSIYHYAAIASLNIKAYEKAIHFWQLAYEQTDYSPAHFYITLTQQIKKHALDWPFTYSYFANVEEQLSAWESFLQNQQSIQYHCIAHAYFQYAKGYGSEKQKLRSLDFIAPIVDEQCLDYLLDYLLYPLEQNTVKCKVMDMLLSVYRQLTTQLFLHEHESELSLNDKWRHIIGYIIKNQSSLKAEIEKKKAIELIFLYLTMSDEAMNAKQNHHVMIASFVYLTMKQLEQKVTYKSIAEQFSISATTLSHSVKKIEEEIISNKNL